MTARRGRRCFSTKNFVLRLDFVIGAERDHVGALFCVVGNAAPVERGQAVTQGAQKVVLAIVGKIGGVVAARGGLLHFVAVGILAGGGGLHSGGLGGLQCVIIGGVAVNLAGAGVVAGNGKIRDEKRRVCADLLGVATGNRGKGAGDFAFCCCHCESLLFCAVFCVGGFVYL